MNLKETLEAEYRRVLNVYNRLLSGIDSNEKSFAETGTLQRLIDAAELYDFAVDYYIKLEGINSTYAEDFGEGFEGFEYIMKIGESE